MFFDFRLLATLCLILTACSAEEHLSAVCPSTCYSGPEGTSGIGQCTPGVPVCDDRGFVVECSGEVLPSHYDICDAIDNNCDGAVDEDLVIEHYEYDNQCLQCGACRQTKEACLNGEWACVYAVQPSVDDATCNNIDEDCDCETDEDFGEDFVLCYSGSEDNVLNGTCRPGIEVCDNGQVTCDGEVLPQEETCDGLDENCNGFVDDIDQSYWAVDIVFAVDVSGSMTDYIDVVANVVCDYAQTSTGQGPYLRLGLILISSPSGGLTLVQNLAGAETLCASLQSIVVEGGSEPTLSAAEDVVDPTNPLLIDWSASSKRVFVGFGDEPAQARCSGMPICDMEQTVVNTLAYCVESQTDVYWFVTDVPLYVEQAVGCGGELFWLSSYEEMMASDLNSILEDVCLEGIQP